MTNTRKFTEKDVQNLKTMSDRLVGVSREITGGGENKIKRMLLPFQSYSRFLEDLPEGQGEEYNSETTYNRGDIVWAPLPQVGIPAYFVCLTDGTSRINPIGMMGTYPEAGWCLAGFGGGTGKHVVSGTGTADGLLCVAEGVGSRAAGLMCRVGQRFSGWSYVYLGDWESGITYFGGAVVRHGGTFYRVNDDVKHAGTTQEPGEYGNWVAETSEGITTRIATMEAEGVSKFGSLTMEIHPDTTSVPAECLFDISRAVTFEISDYGTDMSPPSSFLTEGLYTAVVEDVGFYKRVELIYTNIEWQENGRIDTRAAYSNVSSDLWRDLYFPAFMALMSGSPILEPDIMLGSEAKGLMVEVAKPNCSASGAMHQIAHTGCQASGAGVLSQWEYSSYLAGDVREYSRGQKVRVPLTGELVHIDGPRDTWVLDYEYSYGDTVTHQIPMGEPTNYVCVRPHTSNSGNAPGQLSPGDTTWLASSLNTTLRICRPLGSWMASALRIGDFELPKIAGTYFIKGSFLVRSLGSDFTSGETIAIFSVNMVVECDQEGTYTLLKDEITQEYPEEYPETPDVDFTVWDYGSSEVRFNILDTSGGDTVILFYSGELDIHMFIEPGEWPTP